MSGEHKQTQTRPMTPKEKDEVSFTSTLDITEDDLPSPVSPPVAADTPACLVLIYPDNLHIGSRYAIDGRELHLSLTPTSSGKDQRSLKGQRVLAVVMVDVR